MTSLRTKYYLDKQNAKWKGVCAGLADFLGVDVVFVRVATVVLTFATGFWPFFLTYLIISWVADRKPIALYEQTPEQNKFWQQVRTNPKRTVRDVKAQLRDVDRRLADMERHYVSGNKRLADEIDSLK
jgi:phage shock protein C